MFETLEVCQPHGLARRFGTFVVSLAVHVVGIGALVLIPLLWLNILPDLNVLTFLIAAPAFPPSPEPPHPEAFWPASDGGGSRVIGRIGDSPPIKIPDHIVLDDAPPAGLPQWGVAPQVFGSGGLEGMRPELVPYSGLPATPLPPPPPVRRTAEPMRVGGNVLEARLVRRIEPTYPPLAIRARVSGTVMLEVTVSEEGDVLAIRVLRGNPLLDNAAVEAVRQWKYSPTLLNGEPVPVLAIVSVVFTLR